MCCSACKNEQLAGQHMKNITIFLISGHPLDTHLANSLMTIMTNEVSILLI